MPEPRSTVDTESLFRVGAQARAHGLSTLDNPAYRSAAMPAVTGEPLGDWLAKEAAWSAGWSLEDAIRA